MEVYADNASTTVVSGASASPSPGTVETWVVVSSATFPVLTTGTQFHVVDPASPAEAILVTAVSGTSWTVTRGAEGTVASHLPGFTVNQTVTAGVLATFQAVLQPSGDQTGATDTANLQAAATSGTPVELVAGATYYISAPVIFPPGGGLVTDGGSLAYYSGSTPMPLEGAILKVTSTFTGTTVGGQAVNAPVVMVSKNLGGYSTGSGNQQFRGITIDGRSNLSVMNGIEAWGPVWAVILERVGIYGCLGNGVQTNSSASDGTGQFPDLWQVISCHAANNNLDGFNLPSMSDAYFLASEATGNNGNGWTVTGDNQKWVECKAEFNHKIGWAFTAPSAHTGGSHAIQMTACGTDGNQQHGIQIAGTHPGPYVLTNIQLNNDGTSGTTFAGLNVTGGAHVSCTGVHVLTQTTSLVVHPSYGVQATGTSAYLLLFENCELYGGIAGVNATGSAGIVRYGANVVSSAGDWQGGTTSNTFAAVSAPTKAGTAALAAGAVTVSTTAVTANSMIFLTPQVPGGTPGFPRVSARTAGTSFTITSSSGTDTSTVAWLIIEP